MIDSVEHQGYFLYDTTIADERRCDNVWPSMIDVLQLSDDRWFIIFATRGFLGVDDGFRGNDNDRSLLYQLRANRPDGPVIKEGCIQRYREDWDPLEIGKSCLMQHCPTGSFGLPKRAGSPVAALPHENVFVTTWYCEPRARGADAEHVPSAVWDRALYRAAFHIGWMQFRLADDGNDIDILQPPQPMRQRGFEHGDVFCDMVPPCYMNKWYVRPAAYNAEQSEWVQVPHFQYGLAAIRWQFNAQSGLYEWVQTGPLLTNPSARSHGEPFIYMESTVVRHRDRWLVAARTHSRDRQVHGVAWFQMDDLFGRWPEPIMPGAPVSKSQCALFHCADDKLRLFTSDATVSPYRQDRNPLYAWEIDVDRGCCAGARTTIFDAEAADLRVRPETQMRVDAPNLLPAIDPHEQLITYRVRLRRRTEPRTRLVAAERDRSAIYFAKIRYKRVGPDV